jgi:hypothetical protein
MTSKIPLTLTLAALVGFAAPAFATEHAAAKHDPQVATTTAKPKTAEKAAPAKETKTTAVKGRHAKAKSAKKTTASTHATAATSPAAK